MIYETNDLVLPMLELPDPCPVKIKITEKDVCLYIGQRDFQWDKETGEWVGQGTRLAE